MLNIEVQKLHGLAVITLAQDLDAPSVSTASERCRRALQDQPERVVVHLEGIRFIDSRGVRFLLALVQAAEARGSGCALVTGGNPRVHRVLQLLRLEECLPVYLTCVSALRELEELHPLRHRRL